MVTLYCKNHHHGQPLCAECRRLLDYALQRVQKCKFGEDKPTCEKCPVHCYRKDEKEAIRKVMRYAGPRMILHHPCMALRHLVNGISKNSQYKNSSG